MQYQALLLDAADATDAKAIIDSIEKPWACADQELFISSVILNPFYQSNEKYLVFANLPFLNRAGIHALLAPIYRQLFKGETLDQFTDNINNYLSGKGLFFNLEMLVARFINVADRNVSAQY